MSKACAIDTTEINKLQWARGLGGSGSIAVGMLGFWKGFKDIGK